MSKKPVPPNTIPELPADPKFADLRELLMESAKETNRRWTGTTLAHFFDGMSESKRSEYALFCLEWYKFLKKTCPNEYQDKLPAFFPKKTTVQHAFLAAKTTILACCTRKDIEKVLREDGASFLDVEFEIIMRSRRPDWLSDFMIWIAGGTGLMDVQTYDYWEIYRRFVREKIIKPVKNDLWIRTMFTAMLFETMNDFDCVPTSLVDQLYTDPDLMKTDIWYYFDFTQFPNGWNLTSWDAHFSFQKERRKGEDWKGTFCTLVQKGEIPKNRVIDGCFQSLGRPFSDHECKWYVQLLEQLIDRLKLSDDELAGDSRYIDLMHNANPTPRSLGLKILERLFKSGKIADCDAIPLAASLFTEPVKGKAKKGVTLLTQIAKRSHDLHGEVFHALLDALQHEATEIQQAAVELLIKYDAFHDAAIVAEVRKISLSLAASVRKCLPANQSMTRKLVPDQSTQLVPTKIALEKIVPIATFDELLDTASKLMEQAANMDEVERFLDGVSRLGTHRPEDFTAKTDPLLMRIPKKIPCKDGIQDVAKNKWDVFIGFIPLPFSGYSVYSTEMDTYYLIASWIMNSLPIIETLDPPVIITREGARFCDDPGTYHCSLRIGKKLWIFKELEDFEKRSGHEIRPATMLFSKRVENVVKHFVAGKPRQLLSTPTHVDGWIDPLVFVQRLIDANANHVEHDDYDKVLALLRLLPDGREAALKLFEAAVKKRDDYCNAVRYALGADKVKIGSTAHYWIAAARYRSPIEDDLAVEAAFPGYGPNAGSTAHYTIRRCNNQNKLIVAFQPVLTAKIVDLSLFPSVGLWAEELPSYGSELQIRWMLTIWPQNLDPVIATALTHYSENINSNTDYGFRYVLEAMERPGVTTRSLSVTALFLGLGMKCSLVSTTATDTLITVIADGRLTVELALVAIRELLGFHYVTLSRWLKPLKTIAEQSDRHAVFVYELLTHIVESIPSKETGGFLELLYELAVSLDRPVRSDECRRFLESLTGNGKAAKIAKRLLGG